MSFILDCSPAAGGGSEAGGEVGLGVVVWLCGEGFCVVWSSVARLSSASFGATEELAPDSNGAAEIKSAEGASGSVVWAAWGGITSAAEVTCCAVAVNGDRESPATLKAQMLQMRCKGQTCGKNDKRIPS